MDASLDEIIQTRNIGFRGGFRGGQRGRFNGRGGGGFRGNFNFNRNFNRPQQFQQRRNFNNQGFNNGGGFMNRFGQQQFNGGSDRPFFQKRFQDNYGQFPMRRQGFQNFNSMGQNFNSMGQNFNQRPGSFGGQIKRFDNINNPTAMAPQGEFENGKLYVSNLDFGVTNQDIKELFGEFGAFVRYGVNFSSAGRSVGSAEVIFRNRSSAVQAYQKYNGVTLDGRPMRLELSGGNDDAGIETSRPGYQEEMQLQPNPRRLQAVRDNANPVSQGGGFIPRRTFAQNAVRRARNNFRFGGPQRLQGRITKSKDMMMGGNVAMREEPDASALDADLDAYNASKD